MWWRVKYRERARSVFMVPGRQIEMKKRRRETTWALNDQERKVEIALLNGFANLVRVLTLSPTRVNRGDREIIGLPTCKVARGIACILTD